MKYKVKYLSITPKTEKKDLYGCNFYLGTSLRNPFFWGNHMPLLCEWISTRFPVGIIVIGDYLDRFNQFIFAEKLSVDDSIRLSIESGIKLEKTIHKYVSQLENGNITIERWSKYYENEVVQNIKTNLFRQLNESPDFYSSVKQSAIGYLKNKAIGNLSNILNDKNINFSIEYILEEMAVFSFLIELGYKVQLYPGTQLSVLKQIANKEIILNDSNLDQGIYVDLTVKKVGKK